MSSCAAAQPRSNQISSYNGSVRNSSNVSCVLICVKMAAARSNLPSRAIAGTRRTRPTTGNAAANSSGCRKPTLLDPTPPEELPPVVAPRKHPLLLALAVALPVGIYSAVKPYSAFDRIAYWNMFRRPAKLPSRATAFQQVWWWDEAAAKALEGKRGK